MSEAHTVNLVSIGARVPAELAGEIRRMAFEGNRSTSREIRAALLAHARSHGAHLRAGEMSRSSTPAAAARLEGESP